MSEYITTYTGKHFEPTNPDPELILVHYNRPAELFCSMAKV